MVAKPVIRPIAAAIGAAALVFTMAPGAAFAKDPAPGHHHSHSHQHPTATDTPLGPSLNRPEPPGHGTPTPTSTSDLLKQIQDELTAMKHSDPQALAQQRAVLIAQLAALKQALQLLKGGVTPPPVTPATPPPASTPPASPTPAGPTPTPPTRPRTSAAEQPAAVPSALPSVLTVGPTIQPGVQPEVPAAQGTTAAQGGPVPPAGQSSTPATQDSSHAALNQPIPGLSPKSTVLLFAILGAFVAGILFLVLGAGYRGRRRA